MRQPCRTQRTTRWNPSTCHLPPDPAVGAVVCGLDTSINYTKLSKAFQYLTRNEGCLFIATNEDSTYPTNGGLLPGAGAISAPLRYSLKRDPVSTGKPHATMLDCVKAKWVVNDTCCYLRINHLCLDTTTIPNERS